MIVSNRPIKNNYINFNSNKKKVSKITSVTNYGTVSFKSKPLTAKQALKFLMPAVIGGIGITQILPDFLLKKIYNIELQEAEYNLLKLHGTSNQRKIKSHLGDIDNLTKKNPDKLKIIEKLLRKNVFNSLGNINYFIQGDKELFDTQLSFLSEMVDEKEYENHVCTSSLYNKRLSKTYTKKDIEAKQKMLDYLKEFNRKYKQSERWKADKLNSDVWSIGYKQVDIINATNAFNLDLMLEMVKSKTTFIDALCPPDEIKAFDLPVIGYNLTEKNLDYMTKMFRDKKVSREALVGLSKWIEKNTINKYKKLNKNPNISKENIGEIGSVINDFNRDFIMSLLQNDNIQKEDIAQIGKYYNEDSAPTLNYLTKHIKDKRIKDGEKHIWIIGSRIKQKNKESIEKLCKNNQIDLSTVCDVADAVNEVNFDLVEQMCMNYINKISYITGCAYKITKKNKKLAETLYTKYQVNGKELNYILDTLYIIEKIPLKSINFETKYAILNIHSKYGKQMEECGFDYKEKISEIAKSLKNNTNIAQSRNLQVFLSKILANNNSKAENILKTYDFAQFGKNGIPLKYLRKDFVENIEENILSGIKAEDRKTILEHFGIIDNQDYDGLWNIDDIDKSQLISEKGRIAFDKTQHELKKFLLENETVSDDKKFKEVLDGLIKEFPSFLPTVGKVQHGMHNYSVDIHTLKVLQSCLNNPLYKKLSDDGKTVLKFSALMHDIGKNGKVRDLQHASKSAEYAASILDTINLSKDTKTRIINTIENHHWFADYNVNTITPQNIAAKTKTKEDFLICQILAKSDLVNVNDSFHLGVTGTQNKKAFEEYFDKKIQPIETLLEKIQQNANIVFHTKILNNGNKFPTKKIELKNGKTIKLKVLNLSELQDDAELESFGFPRGTTKENARFLVHMTKPDASFDIAYALIKSPQNNSTWSSSLISTKNKATYGDRDYGFILDVSQENIAEAYYSNTGSGCHKNINDFEKILFDFDNKERKYVRNNLKKELKIHGIWLNDKEYGNLVDYLTKKKHITSIKNDIKIGKRTIKANTLVKCLEKSRDSLFDTKFINDHNEVVVINPKIQGLITKNNSLNDCKEDFLIFAHKHNLPIILIN